MVRFGIIGVGNTVAIAVQHARALQKLPQVRITALLSRTKSRAAAFAQDHCPDAVICDSLDELLPLVDCVCICSPNQTHAAYASASLEAGKGVLCEKPLGGTESELRRLQECSRESRCTNTVAYNFRWEDAFRQLRELLLEGSLGDILWYQEQRGGNRLANAGLPFEWRMEKKSGGGSTMDFCSHMLDHYLYLTGARAKELRLTHADLRTFFPQRPDSCGGVRDVETEDYSRLALHHGCTEILLTASRVGCPCDQVQIVGTRGMALYSSQNPTELLVWHKNSSGALPTSPEILPCAGTLQGTYDAQDAAFVEAYCRGEPMHPTLEEGCALLELLQQAVDQSKKIPSP